MFNNDKEIYEFGPYRLDVGEHRFGRIDGSENGSLAEKAFQTLVILVRNRGCLVTKTELLDKVWPDAMVEENNLDKSIHAIRNVLRDSAADPKYIETVRKHGYRFVADVERIEGNGAGVASVSTVPEQMVPNKVDPKSRGEDRSKGGGSDRSKYVFVALSAALIGVLVLGGWLYRRDPRGEARSDQTLSKGDDSGPRTSPAYDLYIRGKVKAASENREDTENAIKLLEQAIAVDPNLGEAYAHLARAYNTIAFKYSTGAESKRFHENAEVAIEKSLALNPDLAEAHFARGLILWSNIKGFPHEQAIQSYRRSIALNPSNDETHHQLSVVYSHIGLLDEAQESVKRALEINPNNTLARFRAGVYVAYRGKFEDAIAIYKTIPRDFTPLLVDRSIAEALIQTGRAGEAEAIADEYLKRYPNDEGGSFTSVKALILAKAGRRDEAERIASRSIEIGGGFGHFHHTLYNVASVYAVIGRPEEAVKYLELAADGGFPNYSYFAVDPNLDNIRKDSRFIDFMIKLRSRWERYKTLAS